MTNQNDMNPQRLYVEHPDSGPSLSPDWVAGFVDGEGCFHVGISKNDGVKFGHQILPELTVVQHKRDIALLHKLRSFMACGVVRSNHGERFCWRVRNLANHVNIILPFFERHPLRSLKRIEFLKFAKVIRLMERGEHLNPVGFQKILKIAEDMNRQLQRDVRMKIESVP